MRYSGFAVAAQYRSAALRDPSCMRLKVLERRVSKSADLALKYASVPSCFHGPGSKSGKMSCRLSIISSLSASA